MLGLALMYVAPGVLLMVLSEYLRRRRESAPTQLADEPEAEECDCDGCEDCYPRMEREQAEAEGRDYVEPWGNAPCGFCNQVGCTSGHNS